MRSARPGRPRWVVINQAQTPAFQHMMESLEDGHGCYILTGTPHPPARPDTVVRRGPAYDRRSLWRRGVSWLRFLVSAAARSLWLPRGAFVLVTTNPPVLPHWAWVLRRIRGIRFAVLVWDLYPHTFVRAEMLRPRGWPARLWTALNRRAFLAADVVITLGDRMRELVREEIGADADQARVVVIPNWADTETIRPLDKASNPFAMAHEQQDLVTVLYSGNLGGTHGVEDLVGASALLGDDPRVAFMIIGDGLGRQAVEGALAEGRAGNLTLLDYQPWETLPHSLSTGDIAVVSQTPGTEDYSFPSKLYASLAAGSAILAITGADTELGRLVTDLQVGVVPVSRAPEAIAAAIRGLLDDPARLRRLRENARQVAVARYSAAVVGGQFEDAVAPLIRASAGGGP